MGRTIPNYTPWSERGIQLNRSTGEQEVWRDGNRSITAFHLPYSIEIRLVAYVDNRPVQFAEYPVPNTSGPALLHWQWVEAMISKLPAGESYTCECETGKAVLRHSDNCKWMLENFGDIESSGESQLQMSEEMREKRQRLYNVPVEPEKKADPWLIVIGLSILGLAIATLLLL